MSRDGARIASRGAEAPRADCHASFLTWALAVLLSTGGCSSSPPAQSAADGGGGAAGSNSSAGGDSSSTGGTKGDAGNGSSGAGNHSGAVGGSGAGTAGSGGGAGTPAWDGEVPVSSYNPCPPAGTACVVLPLGDSITYGEASSNGGGYRLELFRSALAKSQTLTFVGSQMSGPPMVDGQPFPRRNEGHVGAVIDRIAMKGLEAQAAFAPNIVLLHAGTNDVWTTDPGLDTAPERTAKLVDDLLAADPQVLVLVATVIPQLTGHDEELAKFNSKLTSLIRAKADAGQHVVLIDMHAAFAAEPNVDAILVNGVHPNDAGYKVMAGIWYRSIGPLLR